MLYACLVSPAPNNSSYCAKTKFDKTLKVILAQENKDNRHVTILMLIYYNTIDKFKLFSCIPGQNLKICQYTLIKAL